MSARPRQTTMSGDDCVSIVLDTIALGTADDRVVWVNKLGATVVVTGVSIVPSENITGNTTDNFSLQLRNKGTAGTGTTAVTSVHEFGTGDDATAFDELALTISTTAADLEIDNNEVLALNKSEDGSGLAQPHMVLLIKYKYK